ncbi:helix-turn-helix domain-containing protein [Aerobium aerolatum]|uniref:Homeodomain-like domain-containing protein n=1 Tax=Aquamicrobium aerolatum DSM 21857 TaxID=1121003 RepID=A0A1I3Q3A7_9HYPH|nr:helix-turn-helix domain-containing protein [Aquamicrobium aerolatum]SFJ28082.1 Homeodomain-like domain-containing protein [Aquamicrobium aerolatum DSM 21857]
MNVHTASKLDTEKFRKVYALVTGGVTAGERAAAKARAEVMAAKAGMTLKQAVSNLDAKPSAKPVNFFEGFDDWMEQKEPGYKAKNAAARAEREQVRASGRREALSKYGSEEAIFQRTDREQNLFAAVIGLDCEQAEWNAQDGTSYPYMIRIDGCGAGGYLWKLSDMTPAFVEAVESAYPMPPNLDSILAEWIVWRDLQNLRELFHTEWIHYLEVQGRIVILEARLNHQPVASWVDMAARMAWWNIRIDRELAPSVDEERALHARISADHQILQKQSTARSGRRTNADKRADVLLMLDSNPNLSDREIARLVSVSPQTVNNWRRRDRNPC